METGTDKKPIERFSESAFFGESQEYKKEPETPAEQFFYTIDTLNAKGFAEYIVMYKDQIKDFEQNNQNAISAILRKAPYTSIHQSMIVLLVNQISDINTLINQKTSAPKSTKKTTSLHIIIESFDFNSLESMKYAANILDIMLDHGTNPYEKNENGINAIELARKKGYELIAGYLQDVAINKKLKKSRCIIV